MYAAESEETDDVYTLLTKDKVYGEKSKGRFDITIGPLVK
jgi:thiamine biosynthesis lipoprotein ApbE